MLNLADSYCLTLPSLYISTLLLSLRTMLQMDLPHVNVLTKVDRLASYAPLPFNLPFYTEVQDLERLLPLLAEEQRARPGGGATIHGRAGQRDGDAEGQGEDKFAGLNRAVIGLVDDFGLVGFETLAVEDRRSMLGLLRAVDRAGGYAFGGAEGAGDGVWQVAMREGAGGEGMSAADVQERWIDRREEFDERERAEEAARARRRAEMGGVEAEGAEVGAGETMGDVEDGMAEMMGPPGDGGVMVVRKQQ